MMKKSHGSDNLQGKQEKNRRDILRTTKRVWAPLDEHLPPDTEEERQRLEDFKQESIQQWLDSGSFVSANENYHQAIDHTASLHEQGMVHMTVKDYVRSLHQLSETPTLSRGTSFNSCHSAASIPQSIPELLEFWEKDPVELLLDLGFGSDEPDICTQIPDRFLDCNSAARGINVHVFLEAQKQRMDVENPNVYDRFQQLQILDHVANAFSTFLNEVNVRQNEMELKYGQKRLQNTSVNSTKKHQRRGEFFRRHSEQSSGRECDDQVSEPSNIRERFSLTLTKPAKHGVNLTASAKHCDQSHSSPPTESLLLQLPKGSKSSHAPGAPQGKQCCSMVLPVKQASPSCVLERIAKDRNQKESSVHTKRLKSRFCHAGNAADSFEMEEVLSFEEDTSNPVDKTSDLMINRANSCQSDSSGFLEEPLDPPGQQMPGLSSRQNSVENGCMISKDKSPNLQPIYDYHQESEESDSKSMASTSFSSQDWSVLEEKVSVPVVEKETQLKAMKGLPEPWPPEMTLEETHTEENPRTNHYLHQPLQMVLGENDVSMSTVTSKGDCSLEVLVSPGTEVNDGFLRPKGTKEICVQSNHREFPRFSQDKCLHVDSRMPGKAEHSQLWPDIHNDLLPSKSPLQRPLQHVPKPKEVISHPLAKKSFTHSDKSGAETPQRKPWYQVLGQMPHGPETLRDSNTSTSKSVTIQVSSNKATAIPSVVALGTDSQEMSPKCTLCNQLINTRPGLGTAARQFNDVSVQTDTCEARLWHCCSVPRNKALTHAAQPLIRSLSVDTGFSTICPVDVSYAVPAHCHYIYNHHNPYCHRERQSSIPVPLACKHCPCSHHHHPEVQFLKTLKVLQETTVRELCSCVAREMEVMKKVCQSFREHLEDITQHLTRQQAFFFKDMTEEEREESEELKTLRETLRQQVEELEFQLGDRAQQIQDGILWQFELLTGESEQNTRLHQHNWTKEINSLTSCAKIHESITDLSSNEG